MEDETDSTHLLGGNVNTVETTAHRIDHGGGNGSALAKPSAMDIATTRAAQEIMGAMTVAKKFPRDEIQARTRIVNACKRIRLAEQSQYAFPRGGSTVDGPSVRLAECLQQNWGNMEAGVIELERRDGESTAMSYAIDYETNSRDVKVFTVRHIRDTKRGPVKLTDERDIYEMIANTGARRKRACILAIIPGDVVEEAIEQCDKTLQGNGGEPLIDRVSKMVQAFGDIGVSQPMIEKRLGHKMEVTTETEIVLLRKIFASIRDNMAPRESFFELGSGPAGKSQADEVNDRLQQEADADSHQQPEAPAEASQVVEMSPFEKLVARVQELAAQRGKYIEAAAICRKCLPAGKAKQPNAATQAECDRVWKTAEEGAGFFAALAVGGK